MARLIADAEDRGHRGEAGGGKYHAVAVTSSRGRTSGPMLLTAAPRGAATVITEHDEVSTTNPAGVPEPSAIEMPGIFVTSEPARIRRAR